MRVFMLGWEFPPYISGGLGTACFGLTRALSRQDTHITFVLPKAVDAEPATHVRLLAPGSPPGTPGSPQRRTQSEAKRRIAAPPPGSVVADPAGFANVSFRAVPARLANPYTRPTDPVAAARWASLGRRSAPATPADPAHGLPAPGDAAYRGDLLTEAQRYARMCVELARRESFDVVHAHDWLTFPAGMAVAAATGKPLVVHVHSTEFDRAGEDVHPQIYDIERRGTHAAVRVIAVSHLTRSILEKRYEVDPDRIDVVYNGVDADRLPPPEPAAAAIRPTDKIVLFLGRITMQKGPEYFVAAAKKVLEKYEKVKFVMAGAGDRVADVIELAAREGVGHKVTFTGFLSPEDVARIYQMADVYVMPSVSEPFGIAALEAVRHDVPVIISRTSGVSEVLRHALKVDFWDVNDIADKIIAVLKHPPLSTTLRHFADIEVRRLTWDDAATRCRGVYDAAIAAMPT